MTPTDVVVQQKAYDRALRFLYDRIDYERMASGTSRYPFRLQRIRLLLRRLGLQRYLYDADRPTASPDVPLIHLAGTKGKGSTAAMVSAMLCESGIKTGLYTSPHLQRLEERFRIGGACCSADDIVALVDQLRPVVDELTGRTNEKDRKGTGSDTVGSPSFFELTTAMALMHFDRNDCQAIVMEVGLGGRLDSTNVCSPAVTAITSIGLDHQHVLGSTLPEIAAEKAGILKAGVPVVSGVTDPAAAEVIAAIAQQRGAPLYRIGHEFSVQHDHRRDWGSRVTYRATEPPLGPTQTYQLSLEGRHQANNSAVAMACVDLLRSQGMPVGSSVFDCLSRLPCECRIESFRLPDNVVAIVDAAHNDDSIAALGDCLRFRFAGRPIHVVFGTSRDKSAGPMLSSLADVAAGIVLTQFQGNPRFYPLPALRSQVPESPRAKVAAVEDPIDACRQAYRQAAPDGVLVICGSFFLAAETRGWVVELAAKESTDRS